MMEFDERILQRVIATDSEHNREYTVKDVVISQKTAESFMTIPTEIEDRYITKYHIYFSAGNNVQELLAVLSGTDEIGQFLVNLTLFFSNALEQLDYQDDFPFKKKPNAEELAEIVQQYIRVRVVRAATNYVNSSSVHSLLDTIIHNEYYDHDSELGEEGSGDSADSDTESFDFYDEDWK